jgi:hypothetical protein
MSGEGDSRLERMKRLPKRLRIAHLAALLRAARGEVSDASDHARDGRAG